MEGRNEAAVQFPCLGWLKYSASLPSPCCFSNFAKFEWLVVRCINGPGRGSSSSKLSHLICYSCKSHDSSCFLVLQAEGPNSLVGGGANPNCLTMVEKVGFNYSLHRFTDSLSHSVKFYKSCCNLTIIFEPTDTLATLFYITACPALFLRSTNLHTRFHSLDNLLITSSSFQPPQLVLKIVNPFPLRLIDFPLTVFAGVPLRACVSHACE